MSQVPPRPRNAVTVNCCDAWFTGFKTAHCSACHATFTTVGGFDKHRTGSYANDTRTCLDPATARDGKGELVFADAGRGYPCWRLAGERPDFGGDR